jgi:hypothetical protein
VITRVDWDCDVLTNFADVNLGCKNRVSSGLNWVFSTVEEAIILEDDCLPHPTFFPFSDELIERYRDDERIGMISGDSFQMGRSTEPFSYYFSRYAHVWGWASWRRAWKDYDVDLTAWPEVRDRRLLDAILPEPGVRKYWEKIFDAVHAGEVDTWAYQWLFTNWIQNRLTILPTQNLISNIGFTEVATHTRMNAKRLSCSIPGHQ